MSLLDVSNLFDTDTVESTISNAVKAGVNTATDGTSTSQKDSGPAPYANDLNRFAPKYNFMFIVDFTFNPGYTALGQNNGSRSKFAMIIQEFDRPRISYEMEEMNYYNFRTKVPRKVTHENLKLKFIDDRGNTSMNFIMNYLIATHPIVGISPNSAYLYEESGMAWSSTDSLASEQSSVSYDAVNSASLRALSADLLNAIAEIKVYHVFNYGKSANIYHYVRPKIVQIDLDRFDMKGSSDLCTIDAEFVYDGFYVEQGIPVDASMQSTIETLSQASLYPMLST